LIVLKSSVVKSYRGGLEQFRLDHHINNESLNQEDDLLFSITRMNVDEFDLDSLVDNGLHYDDSNSRSRDFTIHGRLSGFIWEVGWLTENAVFAWHQEDDPDLIRKSILMGQITMDEVVKMQDAGLNPFDTIRSIDFYKE
jgi:hypothetical protein